MCTGCGALFHFRGHEMRTYLEKYERAWGLRTRLEVYRGWMRRDTKVGRQWWRLSYRMDAFWAMHLHHTPHKPVNM